MNQEITCLFNGCRLRFVGTAEQPEWVAADVLDILYPDADKRNRRNYLVKVPKEWKGHKLITTPGGAQKMVTVNEPGLYHLIVRSESPLAIPLQKMVFEEVLPAVRKYGCYPPPAVEENAAADWEAAILTVMLRLAAAVEGEVELNDLRVVAALGYGWLRGEDVSDGAIAAALELPEDEVARRLAQLQEWGAVDEQRWLRLPTDLLPELV